MMIDMDERQDALDVVCWLAIERKARRPTNACLYVIAVRLRGRNRVAI